MNRKNNIILIGFMGSGKTTFGRWITRTHNMEFLDTDEYIELSLIHISAPTRPY